MQLQNCLLFTCTVSEVTCNICASFSAKGSMIFIRLPKGGRSMTQRDEETALGIFYTKRIQPLTLTWGRTDDDQILTKVFSFNFTTRLRPWRHQGEPANTEAHLEQLRFHGGRDGGGVVSVINTLLTPYYLLYCFREKEMATHSSILALKIPWTDETGRI